MQHLRQRRRLDAAVAAERTGISERRLVAIEADQVAPLLLEVVALAEAYDTSLESIAASTRRIARQRCCYSRYRRPRSLQAAGKSGPSHWIRPDAESLWKPEHQPI
ncbi:MAG: helix-turn-helix transcriptional regulator [Chloroflexi bacterium]|nr:helix-turn-helix transcriptional regulator [Chloroflexota bacterium]